MKILMLSHSDSMHGAERVFVTTAKILFEAGHQIYVVVPKASSSGEMEKALPDGIRFIRMDYKTVGNSLLRTLVVRLYNVPAEQQLCKFCRKEEIDLIYASTWLTSIGSSVARRIGLPLVWHIHEEPTRDFFWTDAHYLWMRRIMKKARIIFISHRQRRLWEDALGLTLHATIIYNPIQSITVISCNHKGVTMGYLGSFSERKNIGMLVHAFQTIHWKYPETKLLLQGAVNEQEKNRYKGDGIEILPHSGDISCFYQKIDIFVLPSFRETMPLVVPEAMQAGVPVIQTSQSGMNELFEHGEDTLFFDPYNESNLIECMERLMDVDARQSIGTKGQNKVKRMIRLYDYRKEILHRIKPFT